MLYQYINGYRIKSVEKNGFIEVEGKRVGVSNLPKYLEEHKDIAAANKYYELVEDAKPEYDVEKQYIVSKYVVEDGHIRLCYELHDIVIPEGVIIGEHTENTEPTD
jgi:hypothetical protein